MSDFIESMFQSFDILIDRRLGDISFDTTLICTIIDDSDKKNGKYRVSDGSVIYVAYSDQDNYKNGDQIRMSVPMGDFSQKKFILGKYVTDNDSSPITYVSPVDSVLNISGNFASGVSGNITANGEIDQIELWATTLDEKIISLQDNNLYNTLVLACNFQTDLSYYQLIEGNYGLMLDFVSRPTLKSDVHIANRLILDSSEMFGNPYMFAIKSPQAKVLKIDTFGLIEGLSLKLYQKGNFKNYSGDLIPDRGDPNIFVNDVSVSMGCDLLSMEDNKVELYTDDDPMYKYNAHTNETNLKTMGLLWFNKDDKSNYIGFSDGIYDPIYDELKYLDISKVNSRLIKYKGKEGIPTDEESLNLAANIDEAAAAIQNAVNVVNRDLMKILREFESMLSNLPPITQKIGKVINAGAENSDTYLGNQTSSIISNLNLLKNQYTDILAYGCEIIKPLGKEESEDERKETLKTSWGKISLENYHKKIYNTFIKIEEIISNLMSTEANGGCEGITPEGIYSGYKSIYDSFKIRIDKTVATMWGYLNKATYNYNYLNKSFPDLFFDTDDLESDYKILLSYENKTDFKSYKEPDLSIYDNKYCIYWYRYEQDYKTPASESLLPDGWRRLTKKDAYLKVENLTEEDFEKDTYYILEENIYKKAEQFNENTVYYICISDGDIDQINIGLPDYYYWDEQCNKNYVLRKAIKYINNITYYNSDGSVVENQPKETDSIKDYYVRVCVNDKGVPIYGLKPSTGEGTLSYYMQNDNKEEKFMVVVFYNHVMYKSNELIFTNADNIPDKTTADKGDILIFEHIKNSFDDYHKYNITNYIMDEHDVSLDREIRCHYDGLLAKDNAFVDGQIYWYVPKQSTMIEINDALLRKNGFVLDLSRSSIQYNPVVFISTAEQNFLSDLGNFYDIMTDENGKETKRKRVVYKPNIYYRKLDGQDAYVLASETSAETDKQYYERVEVELCYYKTITATEKTDLENVKYDWEKWVFEKDQIDSRSFWYKIKSFYEDSSQQNYLKCEFRKKESEDEVVGQQLFTFGVSGTCGTKYTLAITKGEGKTSTTDTEALPFKFQLKDGENNPLKLSMLTGSTEGQTGHLTTEWEFIHPTSETNHSTAITHLSRTEDEGWFEAQKGSCGIIKTVSTVSLIGADLQEDVSNADGSLKGKHRQVDLTVLTSVPWSLGNYYISGPTQIIYNSYGTLDNLSKSNMNYYLFSKDKFTDGDNIIEPDTPIPGVVWRVALYVPNKDNNGPLFVQLNSEDTKGDNRYTSIQKFYMNYMPKMLGNTLVPAPMWVDQSECYAVVEASIVTGQAKQILWKQPLIILQNRYASAMLNDWDGSFKIDDANGTIMSTMIGAGRKTENNTFSGVLMGDVVNGAESSFNPENKTGLGIYGFHEGAQSFGFNIDGTAFLGKAGRGRILFNGNYGVIASANWFTGINNESHEHYDQITNPYPNGGKINSDGSITQSNAGMCINLEDGHIDAYNFKLTSNGIYLNSSPSNGENYFRIGNNDHYIYFKKGGELKIRAWNDGYGVVIHTDPDKEDHYFRVSADDNNGIRLWRDNNDNKRFRIDSNAFILDAWTKETSGANEGKGKGIYLNSAPGYNESYLRVGDQINDHEMRIYRDGDGNIRCSLSATSFNLRTTSIYLGDAKRTFYFGTDDEGNLINDDSNICLALGIQSHTKNNITKHSAEFGVTKGGKLYANNANISGTIHASGGTIGGWTINKNSLSGSGTISGGSISSSSISGGSISGSSISCGGPNGGTVTVEGTITAKGGSIGGWTISGNNLTCNGITINGTNGSISYADTYTLAKDGVTIKKGTITVGDITIKSTGFYDETNKRNFPSQSNITIWTGWGKKGGWGKISFRNGLLVSYTNTGLDAGTGDSSVFNYTASTTNQFQKNGVATATQWPMLYPDSNTGTVGADGEISLKLSLSVPFALYKAGTKKSVTPIGSGVYCYTSAGTYTYNVYVAHSNSEIVITRETLDSKSYTLQKTFTPSYWTSGGATRYAAGTEIDYYEQEQYFKTGDTIDGTIKITLS